MSKIIVILILTFSICFIQINYVQAIEGSKSVQQLSVELLNNNDENQRIKLTEEFKMKKLQTSSDVDAIIQLAEKSNNKELKHTAINKIEAVKEADKHLAPAYIKALDNKDRKIRVAAIIGIGHMKAKEASPKLREIVKDFGKVEYMEYKALEQVDYKKAVEFISEAGGAAMVLGDLKDEEAIPILVDKYDELKEYVADGLCKIGKKALPALLELARKEPSDIRDDHTAQRALARMNDKSAESDFIELFQNPTENVVIRSIALTSVLGTFKNRDLLKELQATYNKQDKSTKYDIIKYSNQKEDILFLIDILKNDKDESSRAYAASALGKIKDSSAIPALEEALKDWNSYVKDAAVDALENITGKKYKWRKK